MITTDDRLLLLLRCCIPITSVSLRFATRIQHSTPGWIYMTDLSSNSGKYTLKMGSRFVMSYNVAPICVQSCIKLQIIDVFYNDIVSKTSKRYDLCSPLYLCCICNFWFIFYVVFMLYLCNFWFMLFYSVMFWFMLFYSAGFM